MWRSRTQLAAKLRLGSSGFTLIEVLLAVTMAAMAGSVLLLGVHSSLQTTDEALEQTIAAGMAQQLLDEAVGNLYCAPGLSGRDTYLGPSSWESQGAGRQRYNDIDDYHGVRTEPAKDAWGVALGTDDGNGGQRHPAFRAPSGIFDHWRQEIDVYYVSESNPGTRLSAGQVSDYRAVEVRIINDDPASGPRQLLQRRRVVAYVPTL